MLADKTNHIFKPDADFETVIKIYSFDKELRQLVINELEKIEIAVRAKMIYILSHQHGAFWYSDTRNFKNRQSHSDTITKIRAEYNRSDAQFIKAFKNKYSDDLPPSWTAFEIISFGSISKLYSILKPGRSKRDISEYFGLDDKTFGSWLHGFVYVRNTCAHHSRLWNRVMRIQPMKPISPKHQWLKNLEVANNRTYFILSMIVYLLRSINETNSMLVDFKHLLEKYPNIDPSAMGFPKDWLNEAIWN